MHLDVADRASPADSSVNGAEVRSSTSDLPALLHALGFGLGCIGWVWDAPVEQGEYLHQFLSIRAMAVAGCLGASVIALTCCPPCPDLRSGILRRAAWVLAFGMALGLASQGGWLGVLSWAPFWLLDLPARPRRWPVVRWLCLGPLYVGIFWIADAIAEARVETLLAPPLPYI